ncbi:hypothetical protein [Celeribacter sp. ULVN23_4]
MRALLSKAPNWLPPRRSTLAKPLPLRHSLDLLPRRDATGQIGKLPLGTGLRFHFGPSGTVEGLWSSEAGQRFHVRAIPCGALDWFALHIDLPDFESLAELSQIAVLMRAASAQPLSLSLAIRSYRSDGFQDSFLHSSIALRPAGDNVCCALSLAQAPDFPRMAAKRELVFFLPTKGPAEFAIDMLKVLSL